MGTSWGVASRAKPAAPPNGRLEAMSFHSAVEGGPGEAERGRRMAHIAIVERERADDRAALHVVEIERGAGSPALYRYNKRQPLSWSKPYVREDHFKGGR